MGWTLNRYFFFCYATITLWFFIGIFAIVGFLGFGLWTLATGIALLRSKDDGVPAG